MMQASASIQFLRRPFYTHGTLPPPTIVEDVSNQWYMSYEHAVDRALDFGLRRK